MNGFQKKKASKKEKPYAIIGHVRGLIFYKKRKLPDSQKTLVSTEYFRYNCKYENAGIFQTEKSSLFRGNPQAFHFYKV